MCLADIRPATGSSMIRDEGLLAGGCRVGGGFNVTTVSSIEMGAGSVALSARPALPATRVWLVDSGNNTIQQNSVLFDNAKLANCGMHLGGVKSAYNVIRQNTATKANMAGIMLSDAGAGNLVIENIFNGNGRFGIHNRNTLGTRIEGNRTSYNRGPWGTTPYPKEVVGVGIGINVQDSTGLVVFDNRVRGNTGVDINWDGKGEVTFEANACDTAAPASICVR